MKMRKIYRKKRRQKKIIKVCFESGKSLGVKPNLDQSKSAGALFPLGRGVVEIFDALQPRAQLFADPCTTGHRTVRQTDS